MAGPQPVPQFGIAPDGECFRLWDAAFMAYGQTLTDNPIDQASSQAQAQYIELFSTKNTGSFDYRRQMPAMRLVRPAGGVRPLVILEYDTIGALDDGGPPGNPPQFDANHPPDVFNYDTEQPPVGQPNQLAGAYLSVNGTGFYIMRLWDQRWKTVVAADYIAESFSELPAGDGTQHYDGVEMDVMGHDPIDTQAKSNGSGTGMWAPWRRANGASTPTPAEWLTMTRELGAYVKAKMPTQNNVAGFALRRPVFVNGVHAASDYWSASSTMQITDGIDGGHVEEWIRGSGASLTSFPNETGSGNWQDSVDMICDANQRRKTLLFQSKLWNNAAATLAQSKQWFRYLYTSFLLGTDGRHFYQMRDDSIKVTYSSTNPRAGRWRQLPSNYYSSTDIWWSRVKLGPPVQTFKGGQGTIAGQRIVSGSGAYYKRQFTTGVVICNPTGSDTANIVIPSGSYTDVDGTVYVSDGSTPLHFNGVTTGVAAHSGVILSKN